jgi:DNA-binding MarR family transcriptional regulator
VAGTKQTGSGSTGSPGDRGRAPLSPLIHGRVRLLILSFLLRANKPHAFTALRNGLQLTDGTLSVHLSKLEEGGLVSIEKTFEGKKPLTLVRVTPKGRKLFKQYVADLKGIVPGLDEGN